MTSLLLIAAITAYLLSTVLATILLYGCWLTILRRRTTVKAIEDVRDSLVKFLDQLPALIASVTGAAASAPPDTSSTPES